jgi:hypothetical protein
MTHSVNPVLLCSFRFKTFFSLSASYVWLANDGVGTALPGVSLRRHPSASHLRRAPLHAQRQHAAAAAAAALVRDAQREQHVEASRVRRRRCAPPEKQRAASPGQVKSTTRALIKLIRGFRVNGVL